MDDVDVSIVVCTFNRAPLLRRALDSLARQQTQGRFTYEIVVVDNASTDDTPRVIAAAAQAHAVAIRSVRETRKGIAIARNRAIQESRGAWIAFHDDDQWAEPDWLGELMALAEKKNCLCVGGAVQLELPATNTRRLSPVCRGLLGEKTKITTEFRYNRQTGPGTNNWMIARTVFDEVGLFDEQLCSSGGEDADLYRRISAAGYACWYTPRAVVHHIIPEQRLEDQYMRWTALRQGGHVALREFYQWGRWKMPGIVAARLGQALLIYGPRYLAARVGRDAEKTLGARCLLWRSEGYLRYALKYLLPKLCRQRAFSSAMDFRAGRQGLMEKQH